MCRLSKRIAREVEPDEIGEKVIILSREDSPKSYPSLRASTVVEVKAFYDRLCLEMPNDVNFHITLGEGGISGQLLYEDGRMDHAGYGFPFPFDEHFFTNLAKIDWDSLRGESITMTNTFDQMIDAAEEFPANIPSTHDAQRRHLGDYNQFLQKAKRGDWKFAFLAFRDSHGVDELESGKFDERSGLVYEVADLMTCNYDIVGLIVDGVPLTASEAEYLKLQAVKGLGPISRALAENRMPGVANQ